MRDILRLFIDWLVSNRLLMVDEEGIECKAQIEIFLSSLEDDPESRDWANGYGQTCEVDMDALASAGMGEDECYEHGTVCDGYEDQFVDSSSWEELTGGE